MPSSFHWATKKSLMGDEAELGRAGNVETVSTVSWAMAREETPTER